MLLVLLATRAMREPALLFFHYPISLAPNLCVHLAFPYFHVSPHALHARPLIPVSVIRMAMYVSHSRLHTINQGWSRLPSVASFSCEGLAWWTNIWVYCKSLSLLKSAVSSRQDNHSKIHTVTWDNCTNCQHCCLWPQPPSWPTSESHILCDTTNWSDKLWILFRSTAHPTSHIYCQSPEWTDP